MEFRFVCQPLATAVLLAAAHVAQADEACPGPDSSTLYGACVLSKETAKLDTELNTRYRTLLKNRADADTAKQRQALISSQRAWIRFRDKTCEFENEEFGGINSISWVRCQNRLTRERLQYLSDLEP